MTQDLARFMVPTSTPTVARMRYQVRLSVYSYDGDREVGTSDMGFAHSAEFDSEIEAQDFAHQVHLYAAELAKKLKRKAVAR